MVNVVVRDGSTSFSPIFLFYDDIRNMFKCFNSFYFSRVKMVGNTVVHVVARWDTKDSMQIVCMDKCHDAQ